MIINKFRTGDRVTIRYGNQDGRPGVVTETSDSTSKVKLDLLEGQENHEYIWVQAVIGKNAVKE